MSFVLLPLIVPVFSSKYTEFFFVVNKVLQTVFVTISLFYKYYQPAKEMSFLKRFIWVLKSKYQFLIFIAISHLLCCSFLKSRMEIFVSWPGSNFQKAHFFMSFWKTVIIKRRGLAQKLPNLQLKLSRKIVHSQNSIWDRNCCWEQKR